MFAEVAVDEVGGVVGFAGDDGVKDVLVFGAAVDGHLAPWGRDLDVAHPVSLVQIAHIGEPAVAVGGDGGIVEIAVGLFPVFCAFGGDRLFDAGEAVVGNDEAAFPILIAAFDRQTDALHFDHAAHIDQFAEVGQGHRRRLEPALAFGRDEVFNEQTRQRLAHGRGTDAIARTQFFDSHFSGRRDGPREKGVAQVSVDAFDGGLEPVYVALKSHRPVFPILWSYVRISVVCWLLSKVRKCRCVKLQKNKGNFANLQNGLLIFNSVGKRFYKKILLALMFMRPLTGKWCMTTVK